jgi:hypothetical protein
MTGQLSIEFSPRNPRRHYARVEGSPRLRRLLSILLDGQWHSTRELSRRAECYSVGASIQELRDARNGCVIETLYVNAEGGRRWEYRLVYCPERLRHI